MGNISITQALQRKKEIKEPDLEWEKECQQIGCQVSRQEAIRRLEAMDEKLFRGHQKSWQVVGFRERTQLTHFGEITIRRRLYLDTEGRYHFLLDEYLGWLPKQMTTPSLSEHIVALSARISFQQVQQTLEMLTLGVISATTVYRLVQKTAQAAISQEEDHYEAVFEKGEILSPGEGKVALLYTEADGIWIHLQREKQRHYEIRNGLAYEGWKRLSGKEERYELVNKRIYGHSSDRVPFWEGASLEWSKQWDLGDLKGMVIGGDGAGWIDSGIEECAGSVRQLDGYHLARACGQGWEEGETLYRAIRAGETEAAYSLIKTLTQRQGRGAHQARRYVERNVEKGRDWRTLLETEEGRGLGTMESHEDKPWANRMKKKGLSWRIQGAHRMAKVIQLAANGEIKSFCSRPKASAPIRTSGPLVTTQPRSNGHQKWLEASLPALIGPHASRPWVKRLHDLAYPSYRLNCN